MNPLRGRGSCRAVDQVKYDIRRNARDPAGASPSRLRTGWWVSVALASLAGVGTADESDFSISDPRIRDSAKRILSESTFQGFDHFGEAHIDPSTAVPEPDVTGDDAADKPATEAIPPKSWWDRLRENQSQKSKTGQPGQGERSSASQSGTGGESAKSEETTSSDGNSQGSSHARDNATGKSSGESSAENGKPGESSSKPGEAAPGDTNSKDGSPAAASTPPPSDKPTRHPADSGSRPERVASRTTPRGAPSLRGRDGVERPVRFAPKPPEPPAPRGPDWNFDLGLGRFFSGIASVLGNLFHLVAYTALAIVAGLIVVLVARAVAELLKSRRGLTTTNTVAAIPLSDDRSPGELAADVYLQQALGLAQAGRFREAVGQLVLGAMSAIERAQWIRYRRGLTLHDYLRSVRSRPPQYGGLQVVVQQYEPVEYGRRQATETTFSTALDGYRQGFGGLQ